MNKKILFSFLTIGVVSVAAIGATRAFFSDTETSTGNTFTAGEIDLKIDNASWYHGPNGTVEVTGSTWQLKDLDTGDLFFNLTGLKPGDWGEDTISMHLTGNDAWACMDILLTATPENGVNDAEDKAGDTTTGSDEGDLQDELKFVFWADDGDNVLETDEEASAFWNGSTLAAISASGKAILAEATKNIWSGVADDPLDGSQDYAIGMAWCYGDLSLAAVTQDGHGDLINPLTAGPGIICDGAPVTDKSQTDGIQANVSFESVQSRHNESFVCN